MCLLLQKMSVSRMVATVAMLALSLLPSTCVGMPSFHSWMPFWLPITTIQFSALSINAEYLSFESSSESYTPSIYPAMHRDLSIQDDTSSNVLYMTLEFSVWYPAFHGKTTVVNEQSEYLTLGILAILRDFLCQDIHNLSVVYAYNYSQSLCSDIGVVADDLGQFQAVNQTFRSPVGLDNILTFGTVVVSDQQAADIDWMSWEVTYQFVEIGRPQWPTIDDENSTSTLLEAELQHTIQNILDRKIQRGIMDITLGGYYNSSRPRLSIIGQEVETFQESATAMMEEYDFSAEALVLRQIGIGMLILVLWLVIMLTETARQRRLNREREARLKRHHDRRLEQRYSQRRVTHRVPQEKAPLDMELFVIHTEHEVTHMTDLGEEEYGYAINGNSFFEQSSPTGLEIMHVDSV